MDQHYRDASQQGYYGAERESEDRKRHQQLLMQQQQHPQHMPHYPHQLAYHPSLLTAAQQVPFILNQSEQLRSREDYTNTEQPSQGLLQAFPGSVPVAESSSIPLHTSNEQTLSFAPRDPHHQPPPHLQQPSSQAPTFPHHISLSRSEQAASTTLVDLSQSIQGSTQIPGANNILKQLSRGPQSATNDVAETLVNLSDSRTSPQTITFGSVLGISQNVPSEEAVQQLSRKHVLTESGLSHLNSSLHPALLPKKKTSKSKDSKSRRKTKPEDELPEFLAFRYEGGDKENIHGVEAKRTVEEGTVFGPYDGNLLDEAAGSRKESTWELCLRGKVFLYVDGRRKGSPNMMSFIRCARTAAEQNLEAFQTLGDIYFRVMKEIAPGTELRVFYSEAYRELVGFKLGLNDLNYDEEMTSFQCSKCERRFPSAKTLLRHDKIDHELYASNELCPAVTWRLRGSKAEDDKNSIRSDVTVRKKVVVKGVEPGEVDSLEWHFVCTVCGKAFQSEGRLEAHAMFHETFQEEVCPVCGVRQKNAFMLTKHMAEHDVRVYKCTKCDMEFKKRGNLDRHERAMHGISDVERGFTCKFCGVKFDEKRECLDHEKTHGETSDDFKSDTESMESNESQDDAQDVKNVCEEIGGNIDQNVDEMKKITDNLKNPDKLNKKSIGSRIAATRKPQEEPKDMLGKSADYYIKPKPFKCRYCPKRYAYKLLVIRHEKEKHEGTGTFKCTDCTKVFVTKAQLVNHLKNHERHWFYRCTECSRSFASESALNNHMGEHTGLKPFKCDVCGRGFRVKAAVNQHKRRMHRTRPMRFFCSTCNKGFPDRSGLKKHELKHKGIRPFVCMNCGKGFTTNNGLQMHIRNTHEEKRTFSCPICHKTFGLDYSFTGHMFRHKLKGESADGLPTNAAQQASQTMTSGQQPTHMIPNAQQPNIQ